MSTAERSTPPPEPRSRDVDETRYVPDNLVEAFMITNPVLVRRLKFKRERSPSATRDEVWDGVYVMSPLADLEHQDFVGQMTAAFLTVVDCDKGGKVYPGLNVSDRLQDWKANYREPDVAVYLPGNPAIFRKAHICGGPDFAVEILGEDDLARKKFEFYAKVNTRELLLLDRDPWALELYRLINGQLKIVGVSTPDKDEVLTSQVLPLTFRLFPGESRPTLQLCRLDGGQVWRI